MRSLTTRQPPYPPQTAGLGGVPTVIPDIPIDAVFIFLYVCFAATNFTLFNYNRSKGHFFLPSALLGGFSMARILTLCLRIGWATHHHNVSLAIAAGIFVNAGILIVYIINILFAQRILRAKQPKLGWHPLVKTFFIAVYALIGVALALLITLIVISYYTLNLATLHVSEWVLRSAVLYLLIVTLLPLPLLALAFAMPRSPLEENFGTGSLKSKALLLTAGTLICVTIDGFKVGALWSPPRPADDPAWYDSKAAFYVFVFSLEILVLTLYTGFRVHRRFWVPNGSSKRRTYIEPGKSESDGRTYSQDEENISHDQEK